MDSSRFLWEKGEDALCGTPVARESTYIRMTRFARDINENKKHAPNFVAIHPDNENHASIEGMR